MRTAHVALFLEQALIEPEGSPDNFSIARRPRMLANLRDSRDGRIWQNEPPWFLHHADLLFAGVSLEESTFLSQSCPEGAPPSWVGKEPSRKCERRPPPPHHRSEWCPSVRISSAMCIAGGVGIQSTPDRPPSHA